MSMLAVLTAYDLLWIPLVIWLAWVCFFSD